MLVFVAEDTPAFVSLIRRAVDESPMGWTVHACATVAESLRFVQSDHARIGIALIDLGLPDGSGVEVISALRARNEEVPILVISVVTDQKQVLAAIRAGASGYILKSDSHVSVSQALEQAVAGIFPLSPSLARLLFRELSDRQGGAERTDAPRLLTAKEFDVLKLLATGRTYQEVAQELEISLSTVQTHIRHLYRKLESESRMQAVQAARQRGLLA